MDEVVVPVSEDVVVGVSVSLYKSCGVFVGGFCPYCKLRAFSGAPVFWLQPAPSKARAATAKRGADLFIDKQDTKLTLPRQYVITKMGKLLVF